MTHEYDWYSAMSLKRISQQSWRYTSGTEIGLRFHHHERWRPLQLGGDLGLSPLRQKQTYPSLFPFPLESV